MVFELMDTFVEMFSFPLKRHKGEYTVAAYYQREGFTQDEASSLAWICRHRSIGEGLGLTAGIGLVYFQDARVRRLTFK